MKIRIDSRESKLYHEINKRGIPKNCTLIKETLLLGDIIITNDKDEEVLIIERKTLRDLAASIKDGRYAEQSFRLNNCNCHNHNIIYLVEGLLAFFKEERGIKKKTLRSAIFGLNFFKGFSVLNTPHINETAEFIIQMAEKLQKTSSGGFYIDASHNDTKYSEVVKRTKKGNITPENIGEIMLSQIPKVSSATAQIIMGKYKKITILIDAIKENPKCMDKLKLKTKKGKERKINKSAIQNIIQFLS